MLFEEKKGTPPLPSEIAPWSSCVFLSLFVFGVLGAPIVLKLKCSRVMCHVARFRARPDYEWSMCTVIHMIRLIMAPAPFQFSTTVCVVMSVRVQKMGRDLRVAIGTSLHYTRMNCYTNFHQTEHLSFLFTLFLFTNVLCLIEYLEKAKYFRYM